MQTNLISLQNIAHSTRQENEMLHRITKQSQRDSMGVKALTMIATIYLPATLIAVCPLQALAMIH